MKPTGTPHRNSIFGGISERLLAFSSSPEWKERLAAVSAALKVKSLEVSKNDEFCIKNEEFCIKTRDFVFKTKKFVLKMMDFVFKMMGFAAGRAGAGDRGV